MSIVKRPYVVIRLTREIVFVCQENLDFDEDFNIIVTAVAIDKRNKIHYFIGSISNAMLTNDSSSEILSNEDLEWDRSDLNHHLPECDRLSRYDINEMSEVFRCHFLDFDMSLQIDDSSTFTSMKKMRSFSNLTDLYSMENPMKIVLHAKHRSLVDLRSCQWIFRKHKAIYRKCQSYFPQSMEIDDEKRICQRISSETCFHLSTFDILRFYFSKFTDKFSAFIFRTFSSRKSSIITEDILQTYDIIP